MPKDFNVQSAPACQLKKAGTPDTYQTLLSVVNGLSKEDIIELEEDLSFYSETGLIGIQMSRLLDALNTRQPTRAA